MTVDLSNSDIFRAFACQELFYDLEDREGGKHAIIKKVIEELCIDEEKFNCPRPYDDTHFANNGKLNRKVGDYLFHFNMTNNNYNGNKIVYFLAPQDIKMSDIEVLTNPNFVENKLVRNQMLDVMTISSVQFCQKFLVLHK